MTGIGWDWQVALSIYVASMLLQPPALQGYSQATPENHLFRGAGTAFQCPTSWEAIDSGLEGGRNHSLQEK